MESERQGSEQSEDEGQGQPIVVRQKCINRCWKIELHIDQLYLDLGASWNDDFSNFKNCFICYRWYTMVRHGVLLSKDRRRV